LKKLVGQFISINW